MSRTPRGYSMLAALLIVVALIAIAAAVVQLGGSARQISAGERDHQQALAIAELGLERTRAYLLQMSLTDVDFDRALDPNLDTTCSLLSAPILTLGGGQADDHLPPFTGTGVAPITLTATSGKTFLQVPIAGGSYLVRIDDNEDDEDGTFSSSTSNNATGGCVEGLTLLTAKENPVRDRDRTVIVTVIGLYPGTDPLKARATRTLRTEVGPAKSAGIYAGGDVSMGGASKACGEYADLSTTGNIPGGCLCDSSCSGGPPQNRCSTLGPATCDVNAAGSCGVTSLGGGTCTAGAVVPPPPKVAPFDPTNGPPPCTAAPCTPFYYLRHDLAVATTVFQWNYAGLADGGCTRPAQFPRLCAPGDSLPDCPTCWTPIFATDAGPGYDVKFTEDFTRTVMSPGPVTAGTTIFWKVTGGLATTTGGCNTTPAEYPDAGTGYGIGADEMPGNTFSFENQPPQGVWIVEGNLATNGNSPDCASQDGGRISLDVVGDVTDNTNQLTLLPASAKGYSLLAGRDMQISTGNTTFSTCGTGGAVMVREQFAGGANAHLEAQLIVGNQAVCSSTLSGAAISTSGNFTIHVSGYPLVETGGATSTLSWSESAF
ncbi:MAG TPA: hypothetical protein VFA20_08455 [Myxococcaceae bacterium]|nr:hypothetical protein [Myxococcaceae bacterium]